MEPPGSDKIDDEKVAAATTVPAVPANKDSGPEIAAAKDISEESSDSSTDADEERKKKAHKKKHHKKHHKRRKKHRKHHHKKHHHDEESEGHSSPKKHSERHQEVVEDQQEEKKVTPAEKKEDHKEEGKEGLGVSVDKPISTGPRETKVTVETQCTESIKVSKHSGSDVALSVEEEKKISEIEKNNQITEHTMKLPDLYKMYHTNPDTGLDESDVAHIREKYGWNELTLPSKTPAWLVFIHITFTGISLLLWIGAVLCYTAYVVEKTRRGSEATDDNLYLGSVLATVTLVSSLFTFYQEQKSNAVMDSFCKMIPQSASVLRKGEFRVIETRELVPGDIVHVIKGDKVPADIIIIQSSQFKVDNSSLTGESEAIAKSNQCTDESMFETANLAFFSSSAVEGTCNALVIRTGDSTVMGRIAGLVTMTKADDTPMKKELDHFIFIITAIALGFGFIFGIIALIVFPDVIEALIFVIGIIIANVPEGVLPMVAITLSITAQKMARKNCLVKNIEAVETLGSTSVICSDKTGTLTQNRMTTTDIWINFKLIHINTSETEYAKGFDRTAIGFEEMVYAAKLCSTAHFETGQESVLITLKKVHGDATEAGILRFCEAVDGDVEEIRAKNPRVAEIPFSSTNKYHVSIHLNKDKENHLLFKGAPERVVQHCNRYLEDGVEKPIDDEFKKKFEDIYKQLGGMGERVIGVSDNKLSKTEFPAGFKFLTEGNDVNFPLDQNRFLGLFALVDPPKASVPDAVMLCRSAGIRVIMVTGDHPLTAEAIARQVGIIAEESKTLDDVMTEEGTNKDTVDETKAAARVIPGQELATFSDDQLDHVMSAHPEIVFARTTPEQKLQIVKSFQRLGCIVAVTGDGVNDSPALKKADIGIAMGITGSDVSKDAADMILLDDNFASIVNGVEEGRIIFDNLKKSIRYMLTAHIAELAPFLVFISSGVPLALGTVTLLFIDLGTGIVPAISFAYEAAEKDIMSRKPRHPKKDRLVNKRMIFLAYALSGPFQTIGAFMVYFILYTEHGWLPKDMVNIRTKWENRDINDLPDSYGQEWSYTQRKQLEFTGHSAFFLAVIECQWADLLISRTRKVSLLQHGMRNHFLTFSLFFETALAIMIVYVPGTEIALRTMAVSPEYWIPVLPFGLVLIIMDEIRKFLMRRNPEGFLYELTYY